VDKHVEAVMMKTKIGRAETFFNLEFEERAGPQLPAPVRNHTSRLVSIHLTPVAHLDHEYDERLGLDFIEDSKRALPDPVTIVLSRELFTTGRSWLIG